TRIITCANHKGGTGKTTTAVNVSAGLAVLTQQRVLLVDCDPRGHASLALGVESTHVRYSVTDLLTGARPEVQTLCWDPGNNLHILPANATLKDIEPELWRRDPPHRDSWECRSGPGPDGTPEYFCVRSHLTRGPGLSACGGGVTREPPRRGVQRHRDAVPAPEEGTRGPQRAQERTSGASRRTVAGSVSQRVLESSNDRDKQGRLCSCILVYPTL